MRTAAEALLRLRDPASRVSAHYLIDEAGTVFRLVAEERRAWHAGVAAWGGVDDVNAASIGIELANPGHDWGYRPFPDAQIEALAELLRELLARHRIPPSGVLGHSDVAPARKRDPGELFPWRWLAQRGLAIWPEKAPPRPVDPLRARARLLALGYGLDAPSGGLAACLRAFQRRFRPARVDGVLDAETMGLLEALGGQPPS